MNIVRLLNKDLIALLISILLSLIIFFNNKSDSIRAIQSDIADVNNFITYPQRWYKNIFYVKELNKYLEQKLIQSQLLNSRLNHYRLENTQLREMLKFKELNPWALIPANVTNINSISIQTIFIDVGNNENIRKNLPVLDIFGLIGKTIVIGDYATQVQLITDKNFSVSIRVGDKRSLGNFIPTVGNYGILQGIRKSANLIEGDIAYTSGISDIYPADIPVAKIISFNKNNNKPFQDIIVEILSDLNNLDYVFIVQ